MASQSPLNRGDDSDKHLHITEGLRHLAVSQSPLNRGDDSDSLMLTLPSILRTCSRNPLLIGAMIRTAAGGAYAERFFCLSQSPLNRGDDSDTEVHIEEQRQRIQSQSPLNRGDDSDSIKGHCEYIATASQSPLNRGDDSDTLKRCRTARAGSTCLNPLLIEVMIRTIWGIKGVNEHMAEFQSPLNRGDDSDRAGSEG